MPKFKVEPTEVFEVGREFRRLDSRMHKALEEGIQELKEVAIEDLQDAAPEAQGILKEGIRAQRHPGGQPGFDITIHARDPESGYDYAAVTRFGHRVRTISSTRVGQFINKKGKPYQPRLKVTFHKLSKPGPNPRILTQVKGVDLHRDWAFDAVYNLDDLATFTAKKMSTQLDIRVFTGGA